MSVNYVPQDAVSKGTYEMLPGCATVVLETVVHLQNYTVTRLSNLASRNDLVTMDRKKRKSRIAVWFFEEKTRVYAAMSAVYSAVAKMTQWADRLIVEGKVDPSEDYRNGVIEPVRRSVTTLAKLVTDLDSSSKISVLPKSSSLHNSLPDIASGKNEDEPEKKTSTSSASDKTTSFYHPKFEVSRPPNAKFDESPPPLPPKSGNARKSTQESFEDSFDKQQLDWFSNPLFQPETKHKDLNCKRQFSSDDLLEPGKVPDFCRPQRNSVCEQPLDFNYIDVSPHNLSSEDVVEASQHKHMQDWNPIPVATSSPRDSVSVSGVQRMVSNWEALGKGQQYHDSSSSSCDMPPALPRKNLNVHRKVSQYDNVFSPPPPSLFGGQEGHHINLKGRMSLFPTFHQTPNYREMIGERSTSVDAGNPPPPLPPKKRNIMSYMEMFGRSVLPAHCDVIQSFAQTQHLLEAVWQQNYHGFSDYIKDENMHHATNASENTAWSGKHQKIPDTSFLSFSLSKKGGPEKLSGGQDSFEVGFPRLMPMPQPSPGMPPPFPRSFDYDDEDEDVEEVSKGVSVSVPPALPPKKGIRKPPKLPMSATSPNVASMQAEFAFGSGERTIPIYRESDGSMIVANRARVGGNGFHRLSGVSDDQSATSSTTTSSSGLGMDPFNQHQRNSLSTFNPISSGMERRGWGNLNSPRLSADETELKHTSFSYHNRHRASFHHVPVSHGGQDHAQRPNQRSSFKLVPQIGTSPSRTINSEDTTTSEDQDCDTSRTSPSPPPLQNFNKKSVKSLDSAKKEHSHHGHHPRSTKKAKKQRPPLNIQETSSSVLDQLIVAKTSTNLFLYNEESSSPSNSIGSNSNSSHPTKDLLRAGTLDALIVLATQSHKNDYLYQEAFLSTYRTFVSTHDLLEKLVHR